MTVKTEAAPFPDSYRNDHQFLTAQINDLASRNLNGVRYTVLDGSSDFEEYKERRAIAERLAAEFRLFGFDVKVLPVDEEKYLPVQHDAHEYWVDLTATW